jgi:two-component system sensor histidine kinase/response regulator
MAQGHPVWRTDEATEADDSAIVREARKLGLSAGFALPVLAGGQATAVLEFFTEEETSFSPRLVEVMAHVGLQLGRISQVRDHQ